ncbi:EAL domain-containing protein [Escherichia coli]
MQWKLANYFLVYQPIVDINTRTILARRRFVPLGVCSGGIISPLKFITIAEDIGFINELGYQIIKTAMGEFRHFSQRASLKDDSDCILMFRPGS